MLIPNAIKQSNCYKCNSTTLVGNVQKFDAYLYSYTSSAQITSNGNQ